MPSHSLQTFPCDQCEATYSRREHLKRHQRSHTLGRPYQCDTCLKRFSRRDVLSRHAHLHTVDGAIDASPKMIGTRVGRACIECSAKKVKCDGTLPCAACRTRGKADSCLFPGNHVAQDVSGIEDVSLRELDASHTLMNLQDNVLSRSIDAVYQPAAQDLMNTNNTDSTNESVNPLRSYASLISGENDLMAPPLNQSGSLPTFSATSPGAFSTDMPFDKSLPMDMPFYPFSYDIGIADSAMDWLNLPDFDLIMENSLVPSHRASRAQTRPGTRQGSPNGEKSPFTNEDVWQEDESYWPTEWRPTSHLELKLPLVTLSDTQYDEGNTMQVKDLIKETRDNLHNVLADIAKYSCVPLDISAFPDAGVTNVLLQLYFAHFQPLCPIFHRATFDAERTSSVAVLAIITVGSRYQTPSLSLGLSELLRRAIHAACERDNTLVRSVVTNQALLLSQISGIFQGNKRTLEIAESMRGHLVTHTRKSRFLDERFTELASSHIMASMDQSDNLKTRWLEWRHKEERKRLGLAAWMSDCSFASSFNMLPMMTIAELQCRLPCDEALWDAPTEVAWKAKFLASRVPPAPALIQQSINTLLEGNRVQVNAWGRCILLLSLYRIAWQEAHFRNDSNTPRRDQICRAFSMIETPDTNSPMAHQSELLFHLLQLELNAPVMDLHAIAGRRTLIESDLAVQQVQHWAVKNVRSARKALYHAAWLYYRLINTPLHGTDEPIAAFNSALVIWSFVRYGKSDSTDREKNFVISSHQIPDEGFLEYGGKIVVQGVGSASTKIDQVLRVFADCLSSMSVWLISQSYAQLLRQLADAPGSSEVQRQT